jgi:hypothetical protein
MNKGKKSLKRLQLSRETLLSLSETGLLAARGGGGPRPIGSGNAGDTCQVSICVGCSTPLDGCG